MSGIINKIKDAVSSDKGHGHTAEGTHGPHSSHAANAADPRVDSDLDGRGLGHNSAGTGITGAHGTHGTHNTTGAGLTGTHGTHNTTGAGLTGTHGTHNTTGAGLTGTHGTHGTSHNTAGPHSSDLANKADPRVDSDRDGRGLGHGTTGTGIGGTHNTTGAGLTGTHGTHNTTGAGLTGTHGTHGTSHNTAGPHSSDLANKADPRVDSDRDGRGLGHGTTGTHAGVGGVGGTHSGVGGTHSGAHTGTHGLGGVHGSGPGPAPNTAGPHKSDMLNKVDPRVDSNLDGSKTVGGNKTYQSGTTDGYNKDPTDAAQVPPSVLQQTIGHPEVVHDGHSHDHARRNSTATHQELHRGV